MRDRRISVIAILFLSGFVMLGMNVKNLNNIERRIKYC